MITDSANIRAASQTIGLSIQYQEFCQEVVLLKKKPNRLTDSIGKSLEVDRFVYRKVSDVSSGKKIRSTT